MISHLHLHLEPEERKRRALGHAREGSWSRESFFSAHSLEQPGRVRVLPADLGQFLLELHAEQHLEGVGYAEVRVSPRRFLSDGLSWSSILELTDSAVRGLITPIIKLILLVNRDSPREFLDSCLERVESGLPPAYVGIDLAGDEHRWPDTDPFKGLFSRARAQGLGVTVHAGEFGQDSEVFGKRLTSWERRVSATE